MRPDGHRIQALDTGHRNGPDSPVRPRVHGCRVAAHLTRRKGRNAMRRTVVRLLAVTTVSFVALGLTTPASAPAGASVASRSVRATRVHVTVANWLSGRGAALTAGSSSTTGGCQTVHIGPFVAAGAPPASYLSLSLAAGNTSLAAVVAANPEPYPCTVNFFAAYGKTATNSGDTYPIGSSGGRPCTKESCWISKLPATLRLAPESRTNVPFLVSVPAGTGPGQYLAGVVGEPAQSPGAAPLPARSGGVGALVRTGVAIGVAVTVPGPLRPALSIKAVSVSHGVSPLPVVRVTESNDGNQWLHPNGSVIVHDGTRSLRFSLTSNTVLPGDSATIATSVDVPAGRYPCEVDLSYAKTTKVAAWHGTLDFAAPAARSTANGVPALVVSNSTLPGWAKGVIIGGGVLIVVLIIALIRMARYRRAAAGGNRSDGRIARSSETSPTPDSA